MDAISSAFPIDFKGCRWALASFFSFVLSNKAANGVSVIEGEMQFTRILGANSAASARVRPSMAPFEAATLL